MQLLPWKKVQKYLKLRRTKEFVVRNLCEQEYNLPPGSCQLLSPAKSSLSVSEDQILKGTPHQAKFRKLLWQIHLHLTEPSVTANLVSDHLRKGRILAQRLEKFLLTTGLERGL